MRILIEGSGGLSGWPEPGCRCASCLRAAADGSRRLRSAIVVDEVLRLAADERPGPAGGAGFEVRRLPDARDGGAGGWDVTSPEGERLLYPAGPGAVPDPPDGAGRYDVAFADLLGDPAQLGGLRARGLITADTITLVAFADHRVGSVAELGRRCAFWQAGVADDQVTVTTDRSAEGFEDLFTGVRRWPWRVLVLGGARSGKSERAELRLAGEPDVTYVATGSDGAGDPDWAARVAAHRARRPAWWRTAETCDLAGVLARARGAVLIDGIGTWLAAAMDECGAWDGDGAGLLAARVAELVAAWRQTRGYVVAVSDEAGMGVVPATSAGRLFRDELGRLNQALAAESEETELILAGQIVPLGVL
jgi:adenosylcobinamide kinase / adenosylcobinamide-phosphate guanylyltransferase